MYCVPTQLQLVQPWAFPLQRHTHLCRIDYVEELKRNRVRPDR